jgi:glutamate-1-semialdehyde 2,1-aminomutase
MEQTALVDLSFPVSTELIARARTVIPNGTGSTGRAGQQPIPLHYASASGSRLVDVDGNEYIDYRTGMCSTLFGHRPPEVLERVQAQLSEFLHCAGQSRAELELAERLVVMVPGFEMVSFYSSGSEAVHAGLWLAKRATGRSRILRFEGHEHGWIYPMPLAYAPGMDHEMPNWPTDDVLVCRHGDAAHLEELMAEHGDEIATVIMEPIYGTHYPPDVPLLRTARQLCDEHGALLFFDEIVSGLRVAAGGAQERLGVVPDITTEGKALGSGFPINALGALRVVWEAALANGLRISGTYNGDPVCAAAACATVAIVERDRDWIYPHLDALGAALVQGLRDAAKAHGAPMGFSQFGPCVATVWGADDPVTSLAQRRGAIAPVINGKTPLQLFEEELTRRGVASLAGGSWYISAAHSMSDIDETVTAAHAALAAAMARMSGT